MVDATAAEFINTLEDDDDDDHSACGCIRSSFWVFNLFCFVGDPLLYLSLVDETKNRLT